MSDLAHGDRSGPDAGQGAGNAGPDNNSARGWKTNGAGAAAAENSLDTALEQKKTSFSARIKHILRHWQSWSSSI